MEIFAHRGFSKRYPENTLIAFQQAAKLPVDGVEFDVQLTKDNEVVVIHDEKIDRTSTGKGFVHQYTLRELRELSFGKWFAPLFAGEKIPTLQEVLAIFANTTHHINIELKTDIFAYQGIEARVLQIIHDAQLAERVTISSFNHESLVRVKKLDPSIRVAALFESLVLDIESYNERLQSEALHIPYYHIEREIIQHAIANGVTVRTYTVNDVALAKQLQQRGVAAIFTDDPELMLKNLT